MGKKIGRPRKGAEVRSVTFSIRCTPAELRAIRRLTAKTRKTRNDLVLDRTLGVRARAAMNAKKTIDVLVS